MNEDTGKRFNHVKYDAPALLDQNAAKEIVTRVEEFCERLKPGRAKSLALTALEECYMWIGKAIRDEQIERNNQEGK